MGPLPGLKPSASMKPVVKRRLRLRTQNSEPRTPPYLPSGYRNTDRIDVLVNNAGYVLLGLAEACTLEQVQRILNTNLLGAVRMNRAILPQMRLRGSGLLVYISSGAGRIALPGMGFYSASKFALEALAEAYRYELVSEGIDSVVVEPGAFRMAVFEKTEHAADSSGNKRFSPKSEVKNSFSCPPSPWLRRKRRRPRTLHC
jgi:NAD(P)-dependent dehydrogenase (short-subunit alcohol dehydrogenase family)